MSEHAKNIIIVVLVIAIIAILGVIVWTNNAVQDTTTPSETATSTYETNTPAPDVASSSINVNGSTN